MNEVINANHPDVIAELLIKGDLAKLTTQQRAEYYLLVCKSVGLNAATHPLEYLHLNGKLVLYALKGATDQLRRIYGVSVTIVDRKVQDGYLNITVRASDASGRTDDDVGSVPFPDTLKGEARSNTIMKCVTKAKRRATLSFCGLGFLDETEVEAIPAHAKRLVDPEVAAASKPPFDPETGEVK